MAFASKNELKIRRAKSADTQRIAELSGQLGYPATVVQMRERLRGIKPASQHAVLVAESAKDGVIGWLHVSRQPLLEVETRAEVNGLVVAEGQRSAGAGAHTSSTNETATSITRRRSPSENRCNFGDSQTSVPRIIALPG